MKVKKRNGTVEDFDPQKILNAVEKAYKACGYEGIGESCKLQLNGLIELYSYSVKEVEDIENIQDNIETILMDTDGDVAKAFIRYRGERAQLRMLDDRINYIQEYSAERSNAATASETDPNANCSQKNVASLEGEVYKVWNRLIQRRMMKKKLKEMYPEVADQYEKDLKNFICYAHDEASSPVLKYYCQAVSLYPLMTEGVGNVDGTTPKIPNDLRSFSGQLVNLAFLLSSQCKGAVAFGEYLIALSWYAKKDFGDKWWENVDRVVSAEGFPVRTVKSELRKAMKSFIYGVNQPAGNRSFNSPFTNVSIYDKTYFHALFDDFYFPDNTQAEWEAVDTVQRIFMELRRDLNLIKPLTFPVVTVAMVNDGKDIIDQDYKRFCAEEWAKGSSHFCYNSDNPSSLASCCRVLNEITENTFSSTTGMTGVMTGSCNVISLNCNRIVQDFCRERGWAKETFSPEKRWAFYDQLREYMNTILERVYKYHIAFKTMLYEVEDAGMFASSNGNYIYMKKLYSTVGLIGYQEAAMFLGLDPTNNNEYIEFIGQLLSIVKDGNKEHSIRNKKRPFLFNSEAIPGESLAVKFYNADKKDGYWVPEDRNLFASYFFNPWNDSTSVLDKMKLHGFRTSKFTDGGQACHINLDAHLSVAQYEKLIDVSTSEGCTYFTFNIPISECKDCGHVVNAPIGECPHCHSKNIDYWTRIIGYLRPLSSFSDPRKEEANKRYYAKV